MAGSGLTKELVHFVNGVNNLGSKIGNVAKKAGTAERGMSRAMVFKGGGKLVKWWTW